MLTLASTPTQINAVSIADDVPWLSRTLANGNVLQIFVSVDDSFGLNGGMAVHAVQIGLDGVAIAGSQFQVTPMQESTELPSQIHILADGSAAVYTRSYDGLTNSEKISIARFNLASGATYGSQLSNQTIEFIPPVGYSSDNAIFELEGLVLDAFGNVQLVVDVNAIVTQTSSGIQSQVFGTYLLGSNAVGTVIETANPTTLLVNASFDTVISLSSGALATVRDLAVRFLDGSGGTNLSNYQAHPLQSGVLPGTSPVGIERTQLNELPDGKLLVTWLSRSYDESQSGLFFSVVDPSLPPYESIVTGTTTIVIPIVGPVNGNLVGDYNVEVLSNGTFIFAWTVNTLASDGSIDGQAFMQHYSPNGSALGAVVSLGVTGGGDFFVNFAEQADGQLLVTWGQETATDPDGYDVISALFDVTLPASVLHESPYIDVKLANNQVAQLYIRSLEDGISTEPSIESRVRILDANGQPTGTDFFVANHFLDRAQIIEFNDGRIGLVFSNGNLQTEADFLQISIFSANGTPIVQNVLLSDGELPSGTIPYSGTIRAIDTYVNTDGSVTIAFSQDFYVTTGVENPNVTGTYLISVNSSGVVSAPFEVSATEVVDYLRLGTGKVVRAHVDDTNPFHLEIRQSGTLLHTITVNQGDMIDPSSSFNGRNFDYTDNESLIDLGNGNFLFSWVQGNFETGQKDGLFYAIGNENGTISDEYAVAYDVGLYWIAEPVALAGGGFMLAWLQTPDDNDENGFATFNTSQAYYQQFSAAGVAMSAPIAVGTAGSVEAIVTMEVLGNGNVLVSWGQKDGAPDVDFDLASTVVTPLTTLSSTQLNQYVGGDFGQIYRDAVTHSNATSASATQLVMTSTLNPLWSATLVGTSFTYGANGFTGGQITGIQMYFNGVLQASMSGLTLDALFYQSALISGSNGDWTAHDLYFQGLPGSYSAVTATGGVIARGGLHVDNIVGSAYADVLDSGAGDDVVNGGGGNDLIEGRAGADYLDGGIGTSDGLGYLTSNVGVIVNIEINTASGGDADGDVISNFENISGSEFDDILVGSLAANVLAGNAGNDTLNGGLGSDTLRGGAGDDTLIVDAAGDIVVELFGEGLDTVIASASYSLASGVEVEVLRTSSSTAITAINLGGNALTQTITGNDGINDLRTGGGAADTLIGRGGNDTYRVYNSGDIIVEAAGGGTADRVVAAVSFTLASDDNIEAMQTSGSTGTVAINLSGNALAQTITGNDGINELRTGGAAADTLVGRGGDDIYRLYNSGDIIVESSGGGTADRVVTAVNFSLAGDDDIEIMQTNGSTATTAINLAGNALIQDITGNDGANILSDGGGSGADILRGRRGNDTYVVGNGATQIIETAGQGTIDTVSASVTFILAADVSIEFIQTTNAAGTTAINLTGNSLVQDITGNNGNNILSDGSGAGADILRGLSGNDTYIVRNALTQIDEAAGQGTADRVSAGISFTLAADDDIEVMNTTSSTGLTALNLTGNALVQSITGNDGNNTIDGKHGSDVLTGRGGSDTFSFTTALGLGNIDSITDFNVAADTIRLENLVYTGLANGTLTSSAFHTNQTGLAEDGLDRVIYQSNTGNLYFDADGAGGTAGVQFATITANLALTFADFFVI